MALADKASVEARLGRELTDAEELGIDARLEDATAVVNGYCGRDLEFELTPVPAAVSGVVAKMVARTLQRGETGFIEQQNAGPFGVRYPVATSSGDVWLTAADKLALRPWRRGMSSIDLSSARFEPEDD